MQAGLVLQQGHIPEEHHTNLVQISNFKKRILVWVRGLTASSYIFCDYTTCGPEGTIGCMYVYIYAHLFTVYIYFYTVYLFIYL